jgi:hypothetical protein
MLCWPSGTLGPSYLKKLQKLTDFSVTDDQSVKMDLVVENMPILDGSTESVTFL